MARRSLFLIFGVLFLTAGLLSVFQFASAEEAASELGSVETQSNASEFTYDGSIDESSSKETRSDPSAKTQTSIGPKDTTPGSGVWNTIMQKIMTLFAWLLGVAALTLNSVVYYTVLTMGDYIKDLTAVGVSWRILRDIGNIALIFGFLVSGISIIMNYDIYGWGKKMIPKLLLAAVFLNFSLIVAESVIDVGNLFATQFYTQINGGVPATEPGGFDLQSVNNEGISNKVMAQIGLQGLYGGVINDPSVLDGDRPWYVGFLGIILFIVMAFVFFSLAFILIARFVVLIYLIITSPIGFAGLAIPRMEGLAKSWWHQLFEQTLTAPVLMLLLYIALAVITDASFITGFGGSGNPDAWTGIIKKGVADPKGFMGILISFLVAAGLLLAVTIAAKKLGAAGAGGAMKLAGAASFGAVAFAGRRTVGRASNYAARKIRSSSLGRSETGRLLAGIADRGAKGSFDIRGTGILGKIPGGVDAGQAQKGGYQAREKQLIEDRTTYAKSLTQSASQKKTVDEGQKAEEKKHIDNMKPLQEQEQAQLATSKELLDASREELKLKKQEAVAAKASGNATRITSAELGYNNALRAHEDLKQTEKEKLDPVREKIAIEKDRFKKANEQIEKDNSKEANMKTYAGALQKKFVLGVVPRAPYDWPTAVGSARREAADKIIGESKKDKSQQQMDRLEAILAKADGKTTAAEGEKPK